MRMKRKMKKEDGNINSASTCNPNKFNSPLSLLSFYLTKTVFGYLGWLSN